MRAFALMKLLATVWSPAKLAIIDSGGVSPEKSPKYPQEVEGGGDLQSKGIPN